MDQLLQQLGLKTYKISLEMELWLSSYW